MLTDLKYLTVLRNLTICEKIDSSVSTSPVHKEPMKHHFSKTSNKI